MDNALFDQRQAVLATMHQKEQVIAPMMKRELGIIVSVPSSFNTDVFGTFTREIDRKGDQLQAAHKKIEEALRKTGLSIGIASEGSFGAHPVVPFLPFNRELILFIDKKLDLEIVGHASNSNTNYAHTEISSREEALAFAESVRFPSHGVIVKHDEIIQKGITEEEVLQRVVSDFLAKGATSIHIETDMRALYNPTRMKNIELATENLISKLKSRCSQCGTPGFEITEYQKGLPCQWCNRPTDLLLAHTFQCKKCHHKEEVFYPNGASFADPGQCQWCNP
ncbi:DUF6671 family protein [Alkalihalobacterium alkalicellulosilyticum]|uniref:DUF6671 family protein n=1 Tax=Alkalihalobacterium alkalicellulosilyticum TaxID=1912214 RepID=UPI00099893D8|nr:DUF6671 family protein [Bacillus alkalicellulosilyticus]